MYFFYYIVYSKVTRHPKRFFLFRIRDLWRSHDFLFILLQISNILYVLCIIFFYVKPIWQISFSKHDYLFHTKKSKETI